MQPDTEVRAFAHARLYRVPVKRRRHTEAGAGDDAFAMRPQNAEGGAFADAEVVGIHHERARHYAIPEIKRGPSARVRNSGKRFQHPIASR